ncbi:hypothetical protein [Sorangium sp. So ce381]|uniref:hypothetical protein n=1 Tax=Sorangium sp. So ce381 TaxID=3133307 RepID=UPI003F5AF048
MGAAGLTSSSVEMAGRSGSGLDHNLDLVPRRAARPRAAARGPAHAVVPRRAARLTPSCRGARPGSRRTRCDRLTIDAGGGEGIDVELRALREARDRCLEPIVGR